MPRRPRRCSRAGCPSAGSAQPGPPRRVWVGDSTAPRPRITFWVLPGEKGEGPLRAPLPPRRTAACLPRCRGLLARAGSAGALPPARRPRRGPGVRGGRTRVPSALRLPPAAAAPPAISGSWPSSGPAERGGRRPAPPAPPLAPQPRALLTCHRRRLAQHQPPTLPLRGQRGREQPPAPRARPAPAARPHLLAVPQLDLALHQRRLGHLRSWFPRARRASPRRPAAAPAQGHFQNSSGRALGRASEGGPRRRAGRPRGARTSRRGPAAPVAAAVGTARRPGSPEAPSGTRHRPGAWGAGRGGSSLPKAKKTTQHGRDAPASLFPSLKFVFEQPGSTLHTCAPKAVTRHPYQQRGPQPGRGPIPHGLSAPPPSPLSRQGGGGGHSHFLRHGPPPPWCS